MSTSAVDGIATGWQGAVFPQCQGEGRARCIQDGLEQLSRTVSAGASEGVKSEFPRASVVLGFVIGVFAVLLVWLGWAVRGQALARRA